MTSKRSWVVSLTLFNEQGYIDEAAFRAHLRRLSAAGHSVYVGSTNVGEGFALGSDELKHLLTVAANELRGKVAVRAAGVEARSEAEAVNFLRVAEAAGVDAAHIFQLDTGHGTSKPDAAELERYYTRVIERTEMPIVLSNYPALGYVVPLDVVERLLVRFPQIVSFRDASGDIAYLGDLISRFAGRLEIYTVGVRNLLPSLFLGSDGVFTTEANVAPRLIASVLRHFDAGNLPAMADEYKTLVHVHRLLNRYGGSAGRGMKPLLDHFGLPGGTLRSPRQGIGVADRDALVAAVERLGLSDFDRSLAV